MSWFNRSRKIKLRGSREEIRQLAHDLADHKIKIEELRRIMMHILSIKS